MKRICVILILAVLAACENPLEYKPADKSDELIVNAHLDANETSHMVQVAISTTGSVRQVDKAELRFFVNGAVVARTSELERIEEFGETAGKSFTFNASFKAGDVVRLEVDADDKYSAWNEQVVPPEPELLWADTVRVTVREESATTQYFRFDTRIKDSDREDNYYRIKVSDYSTITYYDADNNEIGTSSSKIQCRIKTDNDVILNEGHVGGEDSFFEMGNKNEYGVFNDSRFNESEVTLRPMVRTDSFSHAFMMHETAVLAKIECSALLEVQSLSQRYYYYMKALSMLRSGSTDLALEDVQIPDNVEGGIGFVGVSSSKSKRFHLGVYFSSL